MKLEEYLGTLPEGIMSGDDVQLSVQSLRDIFDFVELGEDDVFYHMGCGDGRGPAMAAKEFNVKKAVGIDADEKKIARARNSTDAKGVEFLCKDVRDSDFDDATVILFWFTDPGVISEMIPRFNMLSAGCRIVTVWGPLPGYMPSSVRFPYIISKVPFTAAVDLREQLLAVFGVKCVDFLTAWEHAERYTRAIESPDSENNRFVTIMQSLVIWINAKNLGVACGDDMPESIKTYMGILRNFFGIEVEHLLEK